MTDIALGMVDATKESESWSVMKRYLMDKAVLIQPIRGGGNHRNRNCNLTERLMLSFYKGEEDAVWHTASEIETSRQRKRALQQKRRTKRTLHGGKIERKSQKSDIKRRSDRAKVLTNDGELSKAFAMMVQRGVAPSTDDIIAQLTKKFPKRQRDVQWQKQN